MKLLLACIITLCFSSPAAAQQLKGRVSNASGLALENANLVWLNQKKGTSTNKEGEFIISYHDKAGAGLVISHTGYLNDTIYPDISARFINVILRERSDLSGVTLVGNLKSHYISANPIKTEVISSLELKKAACCDLAGCFETQSSVQPQTTNIITNSRELRILGLAGIYNQVLIDGFPMIQGLSYTYGISSIPGVLVENIWIAKGANSVLQGYESISGQVNVITKEPDKSDKLLLNTYINSFGEKHLNAVYSFGKKSWSNLTAFHMVQPASRVDKDEDNFMDLPLLTRYMISNRWKKGDEGKWGWSTQFGIKNLSERRIGGQVDFRYHTDKGTTNAYGQAVDINQPEAWFKTSYRMNDMHRFAFYTSGFYQDQRSYFGVTNYKASQTNGYANLQYEFGYSNNSVLKTGFSFRHMKLKENISFSNNDLNRSYAGLYQKTENIPGIFAENTLQSSDGKLTWILGLRSDHHNLHGWEITPRSLLKYQPTTKLTLRASIGKGWRTANIFSENIGLLVSSRDILFTEKLNPEKALNFGFNATQKFMANNMEGYISLDFYRTNFQNQVFPDYDSSPLYAVIENFDGKSVSNGFQLEASGTFSKKFAAKLAYVFLDVYQVREGSRDVLPFNPRHRMNGSASFMPLSKKWHFDANVHWYGVQQLPSTKSNPANYRAAERSGSYATLNSQFTYVLRKFELYAGVENIFNYRQDKPLISWQDPFGPYFDTQFAWGPTRGREAYLGVRFVIK